MRTFISTILVAALFAVVPCAVSAQETCFTAAKKRQELVNSFSADIHIKEFLIKGGGSASFSPTMTKGTFFPKEDMTLESDNRLTIKGSQYRYQKNHPIWAVQSGDLLQNGYIILDNNKIGKMSIAKGIGADPTPLGFIFEGQGPTSVKDLVLTPIELAIRGTDPNLCAYPLNTLKGTNEQLPIKDRDCNVYRIKTAVSSYEELWVSPDHQFNVLRICNLRNGNLFYQTDISYSHVGILPFCPASWVITEYNSANKINRVYEVTLTNIRINDDIPDNHFDMEFEPGYKVYDNRTNKEYIIQSDGSMRELSITGQSLSTVIPQPGFSWFHRHRSLMFLGLPILGVLLLLLFLFFLRRKRYRATQQTHSQTKV